MTSIQVIIEDLTNHPSCVHGPTLLFAKNSTDTEESRKYFACAACRDRKDCAFYMWEDEFTKKSNNAADESQKTIQIWEKKRKAFVASKKSHIHLYALLNQIKQTHVSKRRYCHDCSELFVSESTNKHQDHELAENISDDLLENPSKLLKPRDNPKREAQYLFASAAIKTIIDNIKDSNFKHVLCIGAPRIHEYVQNNLIDEGFSSLLLDIDERYRQFYGPLQFSWYNSFNNHFFEGKVSEHVLKDFLATDKGKGVVLITDPPFGGRVEPLADGISKISNLYQSINGFTNKLPVLWIFPYFMEPQLKNSLPEYSMLDYKVDYENHSLFTDKPNGRKHGSPVRIFTNLDPSKFKFPISEGYKHCKACNKWVAEENKHCKKCGICTSKNGTTYKHCDECKRCVKPSWVHCEKCGRCCLQDHKNCGVIIEFNQNCFHCKESGHKKRDCPNFDKSDIKSNKKGNKRKKVNMKNKSIKKLKSL